MGIVNVDTGRKIITVINIMGNTFMDNNLDCAFDCAENMLKKAESNIIIVDFHAEATGEKELWDISLTVRYLQCLVHILMCKLLTHRFCLTAADI